MDRINKIAIIYLLVVMFSVLVSAREAEVVKSGQKTNKKKESKIKGVSRTNDSSTVNLDNNPQFQTFKITPIFPSKTTVKKITNNNK